MLPEKSSEDQHKPEDYCNIYLGQEEFDKTHTHAMSVLFQPASTVTLPGEQQEVKQEEIGVPLCSNNRVESGSNEFNDSPLTSQSRLHNCPKHLVNILIHALELRRLHTKQYIAELPEMKPAELTAFKALLELLWQAHKGKIKSISKELLKVIYETGSQRQGRLKLLQNQLIKNCFSKLNDQGVDEAKAALREFTYQRLADRRDLLVKESRLVHKEVNMKYIEIFMRELNEGVIKERISKSDKERILRECNTQNQC